VLANLVRLSRGCHKQEKNFNLTSAIVRRRCVILEVDYTRRQMKRPATTTSFIVSVSHINLPPDPLLRYNFDVSRPVDVDVAVSRRQKANAYQQQALDDLKPRVFRSGTDFISLVTLFLLLGATVIVGPRVYMCTRSREQRADVMASFLLEI